MFMAKTFPIFLRAIINASELFIPWVNQGTCLTVPECIESQLDFVAGRGRQMADNAGEGGASFKLALQRATSSDSGTR